MPYALCFLLFMLGLYCAVVKKNMVKIVIGIMVMEYAVNLFLVMLGYRSGGTAPIIDKGQLEAGMGQFISSSVDPLPQALVLTAIVISLGSLALMISICIRVYEKYGTFDITQIRRLKG
ncbi:MAG TPA: sodium:proton antiporter [Sedimentisphaerales bacterium]|nr:sodium:proton antiporter [Sedimentisphaerales bacterium]